MKQAACLDRKLKHVIRSCENTRNTDIDDQNIDYHNHLWEVVRGGYCCVNPFRIYVETCYKIVNVDS